MDITISFCFFLLGLWILVFSSNWLIQGCVKFSYLLKLTPLFVGLVLVAFGTSTPEAGVGIIAAIKNEKGIALGNIIGSNIANIGLVLAICALFRPLEVNKNIFKREIPFMIFSAVLFYILSLDLVISRIDGLIFISIFIIFLITSYRGAKRSFDTSEISDFELKPSIKKAQSYYPIIFIVFLSLVGVVIGANFMVRGGSTLAKIFGVKPWIIGITVFAIGTSLPELVSSLVASSKNISSISVGNIIGSNIFNIVFVLGIVSLIRPIGIEASMLKFEFPIMLVFSLILFIFMRTKYRLTRYEGLVMLLGYICFILFLLKR